MEQQWEYKLLYNPQYMRIEMDHMHLMMQQQKTIILGTS